MMFVRRKPCLQVGKAGRKAVNAVVARGLRKSFGALEAVAGLDLEIPRGVCFGILGPNGAGKTTTIRMLQAQVHPTAGSLTVLGLDAATGGRALKARLGILPQENNLDPDFTVRQNLLVYARYYGIPRLEAERRADKWLAFVQLTDKRDSAIQELSGGMKRRLILARSLLNDPEMLVLDEPTTGLDPQARHTVWNAIRQLRRDGKTILLTTHYMDEAEQLCDDLIIVDKGKLLERGAPRDLIAKHTGGAAVEAVVGWSEEGTAVAAASAKLTAAGILHEKLPDRVIAYGAAAEAAVAGLGASEVIHRRASLEDVFLRLTGRNLRE